MTGFLQGIGAGLIVAAGLGWWAYGQGVAAAEARAMAAHLRAIDAAQAQAIKAGQIESARLAAAEMEETRFRALGDQADAVLADDLGACLPVDRVRRLNSF